MSPRNVFLVGLVGLVSCWSPPSVVTSPVPAGCRNRDCCGLSTVGQPVGLEAESLSNLAKPGTFIGSAAFVGGGAREHISVFASTVDVRTRSREVDRLLYGPTGVCTADACNEYPLAKFSFIEKAHGDPFPVPVSGLGSVRFYRTEYTRLTDVEEHIMEGVAEFTSDPAISVVLYSNGSDGCWACASEIAACVRAGGVNTELREPALHGLFRDKL